MTTFEKKTWKSETGFWPFRGGAVSSRWSNRFTWFQKHFKGFFCSFSLVLKIWRGFLLFWSFFSVELQMDRSRRLQRVERADFTRRSSLSRSWIWKTKLEKSYVDFFNFGLFQCWISNIPFSKTRKSWTSWFHWQKLIISKLNLKDQNRRNLMWISPILVFFEMQKWLPLNQWKDLLSLPDF